MNDIVIGAPPNKSNVAEALRTMVHDYVGSLLSQEDFAQINMVKGVCIGEPPTFNGVEPVCTIFLDSTMPRRFTQGGKIHDDSVWRVCFYIGYDDEPAAESRKYQIYDQFVPSLLRFVGLKTGVSPIYHTEFTGKAQMGHAWIDKKNYLAMCFYIQVGEEYQVSMQR